MDLNSILARIGSGAETTQKLATAVKTLKDGKQATSAPLVPSGSPAGPPAQPTVMPLQKWLLIGGGGLVVLALVWLIARKK